MLHSAMDPTPRSTRMNTLGQFWISPKYSRGDNHDRDLWTHETTTLTTSVHALLHSSIDMRLRNRRTGSWDDHEEGRADRIQVSRLQRLRAKVGLRRPDQLQRKQHRHRCSRRDRHFQLRLRSPFQALFVDACIFHNETIQRQEGTMSPGLPFHSRIDRRHLPAHRDWILSPVVHSTGSARTPRQKTIPGLRPPARGHCAHGQAAQQWRHRQLGRVIFVAESSGVIGRLTALHLRPPLLSPPRPNSTLGARHLFPAREF